MDVIEVVIIPEEITEGTKIDLVNFFINGRNLIDIIHDVDVASDHWPAGNYIGIHPGEFCHYYKHGLWGKAPLLQCPGYDTIGCWPLLVKVASDKDCVIWDDFEQPHRGPNSKAGHWVYDLKFIFDKKQYESELMKINEFQYKT